MEQGRGIEAEGPISFSRCQEAETGQVPSRARKVVLIQEREELEAKSARRHWKSRHCLPTQWWWAADDAFGAHVCVCHVVPQQLPRGKAREVEVGILHDTDSRLADAMLDAAAGGPYRAERNSPYGPEDGVTHTLRLHALPEGFANVMIEVRNDLVQDASGVEAVSSYLADLISKGLQRVA